MNAIHLMKKGGPTNILESFCIYIVTKNNIKLMTKAEF